METNTIVVGLGWLVICLAASSACGSPPIELTKLYMAHGFNGDLHYPEYTNELVWMEADVTGDQKSEFFFSAKRVQQNGSLVYDSSEAGPWSIYTQLPNGQWKLIGDVSFDDRSFKPARWKKDHAKFGFYTYMNTGAGKGLICFYEVTPDGITEREKRVTTAGHDGAEPADAAEFAELFQNGPSVILNEFADTSAPQKTNALSKDAKTTDLRWLLWLGIGLVIISVCAWWLRRKKLA